MSTFPLNDHSAVAKTRFAIAEYNAQEVDATLITPDTLLAYCEAKIRGIDDQVTHALANQRLRNDQASALGSLQATLSSYANGTGDSAETRKNISDAYDAAIAKFPDGSATRANLQQQKDNALKDFDTGDKDGKNKGIDGPTAIQYANAVSDLSSSLNREGEMEMIQLQSLMSQRQTALQMCSNMVASLGETSKAIASKIGA